MKMKEPSYTLSNESLTVVWEGKSYTVQQGQPNYTGLRATILERRWQDIPKHLTIAKSVTAWARGSFTTDTSGRQFSYHGTPVPSDFNQRIIEMAQKGENPAPLFRFWERLQKNPSMRSVEQLFPFLKHQHIPITPDGCFLAYKGVKDNYKDAHSGTWDNSPGAINRMPRNQISDDPNHACHEGFHVGDLSYAQGFSQRVVVCKVDPENVVCVPYDSSQRKMRVCEYKVIGNYGSELPSTTVEPDIYSDLEHGQEKPVPEHKCVAGDDGFCAICTGGTTIAETQPEKANKKKEEPARTSPSNKEAEKPAKKAAKKGFNKYNKMDTQALMSQSIEDLRQYAGKGLDIVGASKIPGGKTALVERIMQVRK